jgi:hypothetical protein
MICNLHAEISNYGVYYPAGMKHRHFHHRPANGQAVKETVEMFKSGGQGVPLIVVLSEAYDLFLAILTRTAQARRAARAGTTM